MPDFRKSKTWSWKQSFKNLNVLKLNHLYLVIAGRSLALVLLSETSKYGYTTSHLINNLLNPPPSVDSSSGSFTLMPCRRACAVRCVTAAYKRPSPYTYQKHLKSTVWLHSDCMVSFWKLSANSVRSQFTKHNLYSLAASILPPLHLHTNSFSSWRQNTISFPVVTRSTHRVTQSEKEMMVKQCE